MSFCVTPFDWIVNWNLPASSQLLLLKQVIDSQGRSLWLHSVLAVLYPFQASRASKESSSDIVAMQEQAFMAFYVVVIRVLCKPVITTLSLCQ